MLGQEHRETRLVAPFYDLYRYSRYFLVLGTVTHNYGSKLYTVQLNPLTSQPVMDPRNFLGEKVHPKYVPIKRTEGDTSVLDRHVLA